MKTLTYSIEVDRIFVLSQIIQCWLFQAGGLCDSIQMSLCVHT